MEPSLGSVTPEIPDTKDMRVKGDKSTMSSKDYLCGCCALSTMVGYIAAYVLLRAVGLIITSWVPPLQLIEFEKSIRYPSGYSYYKTYFENNTLILWYVINIIFCFFLMCYGIATYYTWSISRSELYPDKDDKRIYEKMP